MNDMTPEHKVWLEFMLLAFKNASPDDKFTKVPVRLNNDWSFSFVDAKWVDEDKGNV